MKLSPPPFYLMRYVKFKDGNVVAAKPVPKIFQKAFNNYCQQVETAKARHQEMLDNITKSLENSKKSDE